ncbi:MAG TPA: amidohydrolase family protein [Cyclobacteriaceae bacterium]|jgi:imidazolonepropionase-like amidohydrolase|nr:amidohydrolase family protein [Cyclobacteriaceae bacterium]
MMMKKFITLTISVFTLTSLAFGQVPKPASPQTKPIAITGAIAHIGNGNVIQNSIITFDNGKLTLVADASTSSIDASKFEIINASGKHVYPGFILPDSDLGLQEISAVRSTRDVNETGSYNPNVRSIISYNTDSELIPTLRYNGILLAQTTPIGGIISGTSSVIELDGWNWEDAVYKTDDGVHLNWPAFYQSPRWWMGETQIKKNEKYDEQIRELSNFLAEAKAYAQSAPEATNLKLEAMKGLFDGSKVIYMRASLAKEIMSAIQLAQQVGIKKIVLKDGEESYLVKEFLSENHIPVVLANVHRLPISNDEDVDMPYKLPAVLTKAGVMVSLSYNGLQNSRNLPFFAGTASAYGLSKEEALQLITLNAAKIIGIDSSCGTLEVGKDANLFISTGDALDMRTNNVENAFIAGRKLNLDGKQQLLYNRFKEKYGQK